MLLDELIAETNATDTPPTPEPRLTVDPVAVPPRMRSEGARSASAWPSSRTRPAATTSAEEARRVLARGARAARAGPNVGTPGPARGGRTAPRARTPRGRGVAARRAGEDAGRARGAGRDRRRAQAVPRRARTGRARARPGARFALRPRRAARRVRHAAARRARSTGRAARRARPRGSGAVARRAQPPARDRDRAPRRRRRDDPARDRRTGARRRAVGSRPPRRAAGGADGGRRCVRSADRGARGEGRGDRAPRVRLADLEARLDASEEGRATRSPNATTRSPPHAGRSRAARAEQARVDGELAVESLRPRIARAGSDAGRAHRVDRRRAREIDTTLGKLRREASEASNARRTAEPELATAEAERDELRARVAELEAKACGRVPIATGCENTRQCSETSSRRFARRSPSCRRPRPHPRSCPRRAAVAARRARAEPEPEPEPVSNRSPPSRDPVRARRGGSAPAAPMRVRPTRRRRRCAPAAAPGPTSPLPERRRRTKNARPCPYPSPAATSPAESRSPRLSRWPRRNPTPGPRARRDYRRTAMAEFTALASWRRRLHLPPPLTTTRHTVVSFLTQPCDSVYWM